MTIIYDDRKAANTFHQGEKSTDLYFMQAFFIFYREAGLVWLLLPSCTHGWTPTEWSFCWWLLLFIKRAMAQCAWLKALVSRIFTCYTFIFIVEGLSFFFFCPSYQYLYLSISLSLTLSLSLALCLLLVLSLSALLMTHRPALLRIRETQSMRAQAWTTLH